jgi:3-oxoacyl-[acyl-carrier protein] reductase
MNLGLKNKTAIVMAASKGLGKATAFALAQEGASVVIGSRDKKMLDATAKQIRDETGSKVLAIPTEVTSLKDLETIVTKAVAEFGSIHILVNNAGGPPTGKFEDLTDDQWQKAFELNLLSTVRLTRLTLPFMKKNGSGRIINMVSIAAKQPVENLILSNAIRAGVLGMAKTLSDEVAKDNITVNSILTGSFFTDRIKHLYDSKEAFDALVNDIPLKRLGKPEEFGALVAFLASNQAAFITGTSLQIDGGSIRSLL